MTYDEIHTACALSYQKEHPCCTFETAWARTYDRAWDQYQDSLIAQADDLHDKHRERAEERPTP